MRKKRKKVKGLLWGACVMFALVLTGKVEALADTMTMTLERFVVGGDFIIEPTVVEFTPGETYADVLQRVLHQKGISYAYNDTPMGFYLSGIHGVDVGSSRIPACVIDILNQNNQSIVENYMPGDLYERSYTSGSGWMYYVNNQYVPLGMGSVEPKQDDVARFMFTLCMGADLTGQSGSTVYYPVGDKTQLVKLMGLVNQNREKYQMLNGFSDAWSNAVGTMAKVNANDYEVNEAIRYLNEVITSTPEPTPEPTNTPIPTPEPTNTPIPTPEPTDTPIPTPEPTDTPIPTPEPIDTPVPTPEPTDTPIPTPEPTNTPTPVQTLGKTTVSKVSSTGYNKLKISWSAAEHADGYNVYRAASAKGNYKLMKTIGSGTTLSYTDGNLITGKTYYYKIRPFQMIDGTRKYGTYSSYKSGKPVPAVPSLTVKAGNQQVALKWKKVAGASGYQVYRANSKSGKYTLAATIKKGSSVSYTNKNLKAEKTYYYKVRAYRTVNNKKVYGSYSAVKVAKAGGVKK